MTVPAGPTGPQRLTLSRWAWVLGGLDALAVLALLPLSILSSSGFGLVPFAVIIATPTALVGLFVVRYRRRNPLGWLLLAITGCLILSTDGGLYSILDYSYHRGAMPLGPLAIAAYELWTPGLVLFGLVILLFPDGALPSPRWRWVLRVYLTVFVLLIASSAWATAQAIIGHPTVIDSNGGVDSVDNPSGWYGSVQSVLLLTVVACWLSFIGRQIISWRKADQERRQQLKWLTSGAVTCVAGMLLVSQSSSSTGPLHLAGALGWFGFTALPVGIGVGILRYRLYDIDRVISRTLAYAIVTGLLVAVYAGLVALASTVTSSSSSVVVAVSTLVVAGLFNPLRRRVQNGVDRRFNRARYDAEATVAELSARLKGALDPDAAGADLLDAVRRALEPSAVSLWVARGGP